MLTCTQLGSKRTQHVFVKVLAAIVRHLNLHIDGLPGQVLTF